MVERGQGSGAKNVVVPTILMGPASSGSAVMIRRSILSSSLSFVPLAALLPAQCGTVDTSVCDVPGIRGTVLASTLWDPDGAGPATPLVVFTGDFLRAGPLAVVDVVAYDPATATWIPLPGLEDSVTSANTGRALAVLANGDLVLGGSMRLAGGGPANGASLVRWTGSGWERLGGTTFFGGGVHTMVVEPNGDLVVAGEFQYVNLTLFGGIARWNGSTWSDFGSAFPPASTVKALARLPNGDFVAAGTFVSAGGVSTKRIARWNGSAWSALGVGLNSAPDALLVLPNGEVVVGGQFTVDSGLVGAPQNLARWDGATWQGYAGSSGLVLGASSLLRLSNGDLLVGGWISGQRFVERWNGATWSSFPGPLPGMSPTGQVFTMLQLPQGDVIVGGFVIGDATHAVAGVLRSDGTEWQELSSGLNAEILSSCAAANGDVYVGCDVEFDRAGVWRLRNGVWSPLVGNLGAAWKVALAPNGDLLAISSGLGVARWNGVAWQSLSFSWFTEDLWVEANGNVVCCGTFPGNHGLARWNGTTWTMFAPGFVDVRTLTRMPNGDYVAANGSQISRWNGSQWLPLSWPTGSVRSLVVSPSGVLFAGGNFVVAGGIPANRVARWNGTIWQPLGSGVPREISAMAFLPDGDLLAVGTFDLDGTSCWRWNGAVWSGFGVPSRHEFLDVSVTATGGVLLGGRLDPRYGDGIFEYVSTVRLVTSTCPATALPTGNGCVGGSGPVDLRATELPWLGGTFRALATGLATASAAIEVWGFSGVAVPLASLDPAGQPNCLLYAAADVYGFRVPALGQVATALPIPDHAGLLGAMLHHQVLPLEYDTLGNLVAVTSSNGLVVTLGDL